MDDFRFFCEFSKKLKRIIFEDCIFQTAQLEHVVVVHRVHLPPADPEDVRCATVDDHLTRARVKVIMRLLVRFRELK